MIKLIILSIAGLLFMVYIIYQMVSTGRVHRKGAKKLRKKLFPVSMEKRASFLQRRIATQKTISTNKKAVPAMKQLFY
jgi:hypothetical protein